MENKINDPTLESLSLTPFLYCYVCDDYFHRKNKIDSHAIKMYGMCDWCFKNPEEYKGI